jgi:hypothetical protein
LIHLSGPDCSEGRLFPDQADREPPCLAQNFGQTLPNSSGEYGEGFAYLNYMNDIIFPVLYLAPQEPYTFGPTKGLPWADRPTLPVQLCIRNSESILNASDKWGEIP